jgi:hypothetical protein
MRPSRSDAVRGTFTYVSLQQAPRAREVAVVCVDPRRRPALDLVSGFASLYDYAATAFSATAVIRDSIKKNFGAGAWKTKGAKCFYYRSGGVVYEDFGIHLRAFELCDPSLSADAHQVTSTLQGTALETRTGDILALLASLKNRAGPTARPDGWASVKSRGAAGSIAPPAAAAAADHRELRVGVATF